MNSSNPFEARAQQRMQSQPPQISQAQPQNPFEARAKARTESQYPSDEEVQRDIERNQARFTSRALETIVGTPGDIYSFGKSLLGFDPETVLPTSEKLQKFSEEASRGYLAPKGDLEKVGDEIIKDVSSMALPGAKNYSILRNFGIPIVSNLAKEGIKYATGDEKNASAAKMALSIGLDLASGRQGGAKKYAGSLFEEAKSKLPSNTPIQASKLIQGLDELERTMKMGGSRPSTKDALVKIKELRREVKDGKIDAQTLYEFRPSINEMIDQFGGFELQLPKAIKEKAIRNLNEVKGQVIGSLEDYGRKENKAFLGPYKAANEAFAAYENSNKISKFIQKNVGNTLKSNALKSILGLTGVGGGLGYAFPGAIPLGIAGTAAATTGYQGFKILHRVINSPTLRTYYFNILKGASTGNAGQVSRNVKILDRELLKDEDRNRIPDQE